MIMRLSLFRTGAQICEDDGHHRNHGMRRNCVIRQIKGSQLCEDVGMVERVSGTTFEIEYVGY
jgi:hypothetical protein